MKERKKQKRKKGEVETEEWRKVETTEKENRNRKRGKIETKERGR